MQKSRKSLECSYAKGLSSYIDDGLSCCLSFSIAFFACTLYIVRDFPLCFVIAEELRLAIAHLHCWSCHPIWSPFWCKGAPECLPRPITSNNHNLSVSTSCIQCTLATKENACRNSQNGLVFRVMRKIVSCIYGVHRVDWLRLRVATARRRC